MNSTHGGLAMIYEESEQNETESEQKKQRTCDVPMDRETIPISGNNICKYNFILH